MNQNKLLGLIGMGLFVAVAPLACGSDDGATNEGSGGDDGRSGSATGGKGGTPGTAGKAGSRTMGGAGNAGEDAGGEAGMAGAGGAPMAQKARLRVVHASPSAPSVDIYAKDSETVAAAAVSYGEATDFIELDAGPVAFDLRAEGDAATVAPAFTTAEIELAEGADYTLIAAGDFASGAAAGVAFRVLALEHDFEAASADHAVARVVHATSGWMDVGFDLPGTPAVDYPGISLFGSESNVELPAAAALDVAITGAADATLSKLTLPAAALADGDELFVIATGNPGFPFRAPLNGFALLVVNQNGDVEWVKEQPWLHAVHASDLGTAVDLYDSAQTAVADRLADNVALKTMVGFQLKPSNAGYTLKAVGSNAADGMGSMVGSGATATLIAGEHYLSVFTGNTIQTLREQFALTQGNKVLLRGVHASSVTSIVDFGTAVGAALTGVLIPNVAPGQSSTEVGVPIDAADLSIGVATTSTLAPLHAQHAFVGAAAPVAQERDFVLFVKPAVLGDVWLVNTSVAGWTLR